MLVVLGCQTNMKRAFEELKVGMDKDQVLEAIGGPRAVTRFHGKDRWFIVYYNEGFRYEKEIHFTNGLATYIGDTYEPPPEKSAAAIDKLNASQDVLTYQELVRTRNTTEQADANFEQKVRKEDKVRIVPQFEPIQ
ncbi:MAG: outer membrane protein assembly factor BamE [Bdellovibrionales bacterium]